MTSRSLSLIATAIVLLALPACARDADPSADKPARTTAAKPPADRGAADRATPPARPAAPAPPAAPAAADEWILLDTSAGPITIDLSEEHTPGHAENFKKLVRQGYYENSPFHRVIEGFMAQGGGQWTAQGIGDVGYTIPAELRPDVLPHQRGSVAAARTNNPEKASSGSQFYICFTPQPMLDQMGYTVFGRVVSGMENVDKIARGTGPNGAVDREAATVIKKASLVPAQPARQ